MSSQKYHRIDYDTVVICKNCNKKTFVEYLCHPWYNVDTYHKFCPKCIINTENVNVHCPECYKVYKSNQNECAIIAFIIGAIISFIIFALNNH